MLKGRTIKLRHVSDIYLNLEWLINIETNVNWNDSIDPLLCGRKTNKKLRALQDSTNATLAQATNNKHQEMNNLSQLMFFIGE